MWDKVQTAKAEAQAREELRAAGLPEKKVDILGRQREILEEGVKQEILDGAVEASRITNLNNQPKGLLGALYDTFSGLPFLVKIPFGLMFMRSAFNFVQNTASWTPGIGLLNYGRTSDRAVKWANNLSTDMGPRGALWTKAMAPEIPPEQRRMIMLKQVAGLALTGVVMSQFLGQKHEENEWEIAGGLHGMTPQQVKLLKDSGVKPYSFYRRDPKTGKIVSISYISVLPFSAAFGIVGNMRDAELFRGKEWSDQSKSEKAVDAALMGVSQVTELPMLSQLGRILGQTASARAQEKPEKFSEQSTKKLQELLGSFASGAVPLSSLLKDLDQYQDPKVYYPDSKNPGMGYLLSQIPHARRLSGTQPSLNILGEEIQYHRGPFSRIYSEMDRSPEMQVLAEKIQQGVFPRMPAKTVEIVDKIGVKRQMTAEEFWSYSKQQGQLLKKFIGENADVIRDLRPASVIRAELEKQQGDLTGLSRAERYEFEQAVDKRISETSAEAFFKALTTQISNRVKLKMEIGPIEPE